MAKKNSGGMGGIILIGLFSAVAAAYEWAQKNWLILTVIAIAVIGLFVFAQVRKGRRYDDWVKRLHEKYGDTKVVEGIINREFWKGMTEEQLNDSLGKPDAVDVQALKTKHKEVWKFREVHKGQYALRITLENHKIVSWDKKE